MVIVNETHNRITVTLQPNRSASWQTSKWMIAFIFIVVATIAMGWLLAGVWMILPFAGFEVGLFGLLMYVVSRQTYQEQELILQQDSIEIRNKLGRRVQHVTLARDRCHIDVIESDRDWHLPALYVVTSTSRFALGSFLNLDDRHHLRTTLRQLGLPTCRTHWWKQEK